MADYGLKLVAAPASPCVSLDEARRFLRLPSSSRSQDSVIATLVSAAVDHVETETNRQQMPATWQLVLDVFPAAIIYLPRPPLVSVDSIKYTDSDGAEASLDPGDYTVGTAFEPGRITLKAGKSWPATAAEANAVRVEYQCGYADAASVPAGLKQAILLTVGHWFENRETVTEDARPLEVPRAAQRLIDNFKVGDEVLQYGQGALG